MTTNKLIISIFVLLLIVLANIIPGIMLLSLIGTSTFESLNFSLIGWTLIIDAVLFFASLIYILRK